MQRYVIVTLLKKLSDGKEFAPDNYPLHVTIVPSFTLEFLSQDVIDKLMKHCSTYPPITLLAGDDEFFGPNNEVRVTPLRMTDKLRILHNDISAIVKAAGANFDEPQYMGSNYRAHATVQNDSRIFKDNAVLIDEITIIDKFPDNNPSKRKLLRTIKLLGKP